MNDTITSTTNENVGATNLIKTSDSSSNTDTNQNITKNNSSDSNTNKNVSSNKKDNQIKAAAGEPKTLTQNQILAASKTVNSYLKKYGKLPNYVTIGGYKFSMNEYAYMLSKTIYYKYNKKTTKITIKYDINNPSKPAGVNIYGKLTKAQYYTYSKNLFAYMDKYKKAPNYSTTKLGKIQYQTAVYALNKVVYYAATHKGTLPSTLSLNVKKTNKINKNLPKYTRPDYTPVTPPASGGNSDSSSNTVSLSDIKDAASRVNAYVNQNDVLPKYVEIGGKQYTMPKFLYLLTAALANINSGSSKGITPISVNNPVKPTGKSINGKMSKATYLSLAKNITNYIKKNKKAPNYANSPLGTIQYQTLISEFSKIIEYVANNNKLPSSVTINVKSSDPINGGSSNNGGGDSPQTTVLNDKYNGESLAQYLASTKNCQVTNSAIKSLVASITKNCNTNKEKATAIYNWMSKNIDYSFYYNSKKGATGTLSSKSGNCVDQAHLSVALYRAAGLAARYVHGECTFSSGSVYGHVWVQVLIDDTWTVSDTTSSRNSLGVVNNWNPYTYKLKTGKVAEITF